MAGPFREPDARSSTSGAVTDPITVLHVDDDRAFLETAVRLLERAHGRITVEPATDAAEAFDVLEDRDVDCVVSDYRMDGMDGIEFLRAVRAERPELPFVLFTGKGSEEVASEAISAGVTDYLRKRSVPDQFAVLANRIENLVHRRRTRRALSETRRQFRTLVSNLPGMVYRCRNERGWPMEFVSDHCADLTGYEPASLVDGDVCYGTDLIHPEDREEVWETVQTAVRKGEPFRVEYRIRTADGDERWAWEQGRGVFADGEAVALEGFVTDVTDRKEYESELRYNASLLEAQMETTIDGLLVVDEDRNVETYNERFTELWGIPDDVIEDDSDRSIVDWVVEHRVADPEAFRSQVEELYDNPERTSRDELQLADGRTFDRYSAPVIGDDGRYYGRLWVFRDITRRKERERELAEEREKYATVVEQSHDGIVIVQDREFVFVNSQFRELLGYDEAELLGMPFLAVVAPEDREMVRERYETRLDPDQEPPPPRYEVTFLPKEGEPRVAEVSAAAISYGGEPADLAAIRDVTDRHRYEQRLERTNEELEVLNRVVRHDIRNDMAVILGWAELLEEHVDEAGADSLEKILASGEHVVELTDIARDYVETLTGDGSLDVQPTALRPVLENEIAIRRETYPDARIRIDEPIPDVRVRANEMLSSVFRNLVNNAVQHNDSAVPTVEVSVAERDDEVRVTVADDGPGIPEGEREAIFAKGATGIEDAGEKGIGLYLVRTLVEGFGGDVSVADNDPRGAVFTVTLPKAG